MNKDGAPGGERQLARAAGVVITCILLLYCLLQVLLACGAPLGKYAWGGQCTVLPASLRVASVIAIFMYAGAISIALSRSGVWPVVKNDRLLRAGCTFLAVYFGVLGVAMNLISRSPVERWHALPALLLGIAFFILSKEPKRP